MGNNDSPHECVECSSNLFCWSRVQCFLTNLVSFFFFFFFNPSPKVLGDKYGNAVSFNLSNLL